jgi:hypothetical protein
LLQDYAPDEICYLAGGFDLSVPGKELNALAEFQSIPSLGINFAEELIGQGYYTLEPTQRKISSGTCLMLLKSTSGRLGRSLCGGLLPFAGTLY